MNKVTIHPVTKADLGELLDLERASFPHPWCEEHFLNEILSPHSFPLMARLEHGSCAGYICPTLVLDEGQILNIAVKPSCRGKGIGRMLLDAAFDQFRKKGAASVYLEVRPSNAIAISLYTRCGFTAIGRRKAYYENGEDAVVMKYELQSEKEDHHAV